MADDVAASLRAFTRETDRFNDALEKAVKLFEKLGGSGATSSPFSGGLGQGSSKIMDGTGLGRISTGASGPAVPIAARGAYQAMGQAASMATISAGVRLGGNVMSTSFGMMPSVSAVMNRAGGMFSATLRAGGGMSRRQVGQGTFNMLSGGLTSEGADAEVAQILTGLGNQVSFSPSSTYARNLTGVKNAAMYLGMDNSAAAAAIGGMTTGSTSASLLRNYGISTSNYLTGKEYTQGQIFSQLAGRMTAGRGKANEAQTLDSIKRGSLGANIRQLVSSGTLTEDQAAIFSQYMIERSKGNNMDLEDQGSMDAMMKKAKEEGNENPFLAGYQMNSSATRQYDKAEDSYIAGLQAAAGALEGLNDAAGTLAQTFGGLKSGFEAFAGSTAGGGLLGGMGSIASSAIDFYTLNTLRKGMGKPGLGATALNLGSGLVSSGKNLLSSPMVKGGLRAAGGVGGGVGLAMSATSAYEKGQAGEEMNAGDFGGAALSGAALGASIGAFGGVPGMLIGGGIGALAGLLTAGAANSAGTSGGESASQNNPSSNNVGSNNSGTGLSLIDPVSGPRGAWFGKKGPNWDKTVGHRGLDYPVGTGTQVKAAAAGTVHTIKHDTGGALGKKVVIQHSNGWVTEYCHLSQAGAGGVKVGDTVSQGQLIALSGNSGGNTTGEHLHFTLRTGPSGAYKDPESYMKNPRGNQGASETPQSSGTSTESAASAVGTSTATSGATTSSLLTSTLSGLQAASGSSSATPAPSGMLQNSVSGLVAPGMSEAAKVESYTGAKGGQGGEGYAPSVPQPGIVGTTTADGSSTSTITTGRAGKTSNAVTINLYIQQASESEAKKFAQLVKREIENDSLIKNMGRR